MIELPLLIIFEGETAIVHISTIVDRIGQIRIWIVDYLLSLISGLMGLGLLWGLCSPLFVG